MVTTLGLRIDAVDKRGEPYRSGRYYDGAGELQQTREHEPEPLPDFRDPATVGCILELVRKAYGDTGIHAVCRRSIAPDMSGVVRSGWYLCDGCGRRMNQIGRPFETEIELLVAALEAAP